MKKLFYDYSGMKCNADLGELEAKARESMQRILAGEIMNPDEGRAVGHYWLRSPGAAPNPVTTAEIVLCKEQIKLFAAAANWKNVIVCGIGGSSLGAEFVSNALRSGSDKARLYFIDNTDPAGMDRVFEAVLPDLNETLTLVISKSGSTTETRNAMLECKAFYELHGVPFNSHAVCVSGMGSELWNTAESEFWLGSFPMWDYVGGRTSVMSAVGLLPLALQGVDIEAFLQGAEDCDKMEAPALEMAKYWYSETGGKGGKTMVVLPYKDSLALLPKYLQQLLMESLGKEKDLDGNVVHQGLAVMGNKGTSDQHSYCQQLVAGPDNVFVCFIEVLKDRKGSSPDVGNSSTSGDYLNAFMLGTEKALQDHGKHTMSLTIEDVDAYSLGMLISVFERAVSYYAAMINVNAYNQPAVEYGKKCAEEFIEIKNKALEALTQEPQSPDAVAAKIGADSAAVYKLLRHAAANGAAVFDEETGCFTKAQ